MAAVVSVLNNRVLVEVIVSYLTAAYVRRRISNVLHALRLLSSDPVLRRLHLVVHVAHCSQAMECTTLHGCRPSRRTTGFYRYFFPRSRNVTGLGPFWVAEKGAWYLDIPSSLLSVALVPSGHLRVYRYFLSLYGIRMTYEVLDGGDSYRLYLRSSVMEYVRTFADRVQLSTDWVDFTVSMTRSHFTMGVDRLFLDKTARGSEDKRMACGAPGPSMLASSFDRRCLGTFVYWCSYGGYGQVRRSPCLLLYSACLVDPAYVSMIHLVFTRFVESDASCLFGARDLSFLHTSYRDVCMGPTSQASYEMSDEDLDTVDVSVCTEFASGHRVCRFDLKCSPSMHFLMSMIGDQQHVLGTGPVGFGDCERLLDLDRGRPGWTDSYKDLYDAMSYVRQVGTHLTSFLTYRTNVRVSQPVIIDMHSNTFLLEMIGSCFPLVMFPSFAGQSVNPPLLRPLPFTWVSPEDSSFYSIPPRISVLGASRDLYNAVSNTGDLARELLKSCLNGRRSATYDMCESPSFLRFDRRGCSSLCHLHPVGYNLHKYLQEVDDYTNTEGDWTGTVQEGKRRKTLA